MQEQMMISFKNRNSIYNEIYPFWKKKWWALGRNICISYILTTVY